MGGGRGYASQHFLLNYNLYIFIYAFWESSLYNNHLFISPLAPSTPALSPGWTAAPSPRFFSPDRTAVIVCSSLVVGKVFVMNNKVQKFHF